MNLATVFDNALAHAADDSWQLVATDMGMGFVQQTVIATEVVEELHDTLHIAAFLAAREEFAVGESACAALAKAVVGLGIKSEITVEDSDILLALSNLFAALVDDWTNAMFDKRECSEQARRTRTDDSDTMLGVVHILEMWWLVERDRCVLGQRCAMLIREHGEVHLELLLASVYRTLYDAVALLRVVSFLWG